MRAALLLAVTILGCATDTIGGDVELRTLTTGAYASAQPEAPKAFFALTADDCRRVWEQTIGGQPMPQVDFAKEAVVILLAGSKPTGGYSVEPRGVKLEGRTLVIDAAVKSPPPDAIVTQAFTSPFTAIAVNTKEFDDVRWNPSQN